MVHGSVFDQEDGELSEVVSTDFRPWANILPVVITLLVATLQPAEAGLCQTILESWIPKVKRAVEWMHLVFRSWSKSAIQFLLCF